ncbi:Bazooka [Operophtera brumata]|uniref:Bazooka n=1 Tax=Operophtera brumata TaxID=104452 RepID=A0A0L7LRA0_OPEBR|nr:Bazooka [Operophtera brumata]
MLINLWRCTYLALKHWLTDDSGGPEIIRGSPQQSSLSHKKPSLFKSLSTMFRTQPGRASEKSLSREALERLRMEERLEDANPPNQHRAEPQHSRQSSAGSSDRLHTHKSDRRPHAPPSYRSPPARTAQAQQAMEGAWGPTGHYVNYDEIQQNLNSARREKLSEVQIGQMRKQVHAQRAKAEEESRRAGASGYHSQRSCKESGLVRPQSNYYEYESAPPRRPGKLSHYH